MHQEYVHIVPAAQTAVLFIHGIVGTPVHFKDFIALAPEDYSVYNMLLDGHGKGVKDFSDTCMEKWKAQVHTVLKQLRATHKRIIIVAHSMGTLFAIREAVDDPNGIAALFLLAVPLKLFLKPQMVLNATKVYFDRIRPDDYPALAAKAAYGIQNDRRFWRYFGWVPRYLELFAEIRRTRPLIPRLSVPCYVFQSKGDEMVSLSACKAAAQSPQIQVQYLENSGHYYYDKSDFKILLEAFQKILA